MLAPRLPCEALVAQSTWWRPWPSWRGKSRVLPLPEPSASGWGSVNLVSGEPSSDEGMTQWLLLALE